ncbi:hypothetical protein HPB52_005432 [Rhipicephalus sanguineus]|uniref:Uncharacterized protein n=1 Tax=Rhipicephalus sanguineus TaxID=34632 RepID=A0A9D4PG54_RHISA|nr:hypothetical protein HPB52_005432 [Rhipicephalus sanguineus]
MWPHWLRSVAASQEPTTEDKGDDKGTHSLLSSSVALFSRSTPECVSPGQDSAPQERKTLLLKPRSGPVEQNKDAAAVPKSPQPAPKASSLNIGGSRPVDNAAREPKI